MAGIGAYSLLIILRGKCNTFFAHMCARATDGWTLNRIELDAREPWLNKYSKLSATVLTINIYHARGTLHPRINQAHCKQVLAGCTEVVPLLKHRGKLLASEAPNPLRKSTNFHLSTRKVARNSFCRICRKIV